jgi:hypothetical protein
MRPILPDRFALGRPMLLAGLRRWHRIADAGTSVAGQWREFRQTPPKLSPACRVLLGILSRERGNERQKTMSTTSLNIRPMTAARRAHTSPPHRRTPFDKAYRRALRLAEHRAWQAIEPRPYSHEIPPKTRLRNRIERLACLGAGLTLTAAAVLWIANSTPILHWLQGFAGR